MVSAFILPVYQSLSPDPVVQLLTQITLQTANYTVGGGHINSTNPTPASPAFQVSPIALRVSYLWTISLSITLVTASIAILIKQWLREFKGINDAKYTSLRARIRIRQFREPALRRWKVFETAAFLPLLIQVSLGFFLLGLCYYTSSVFPSLNKSCIPIVVAWAVMFVATSLAPAISSECPWKVTSFLTGLMVVRTYLCRTPVLRWLYVGSTTDPRDSGLVRLWTFASDIPFLLWILAEGYCRSRGLASWGFAKSVGLGSWNIVKLAGRTVWDVVEHSEMSTIFRTMFELLTGPSSEETWFSYVIHLPLHFLALLLYYILALLFIAFQLLRACFTATLSIIQFVAQSAEYIVLAIAEPAKIYLEAGKTNLQAAKKNLEAAKEYVIQILEAAKEYPSERLNAIKTTRRPPNTRPLEEFDIATSDEHDVEMLAAVDDALMDDELLRVTMKPTIARIDCEPDDVVNFVCGALQHRLPPSSSISLGEDGLFLVARVAGLSSQAWQALTDITVSIMHRQLQQYQGKPVPRDVLTSPWLCNALGLLTSQADHPMADNTSRSFSDICRTHHLQFPWRRYVVDVNLSVQNRWPLFIRTLPQELEDFDHASVAISELFAKDNCSPECGHDPAFLAERVAAHDIPTESRHAIQNIVAGLVRQNGEAAGPRLRLAHFVVSAWIPGWAWTQQTTDFPKFSLHSLSLTFNGHSLSDTIEGSSALTAMAVRYLASVPFADMTANGKRTENDASSRFNHCSLSQIMIQSYHSACSR